MVNKTAFQLEETALDRGRTDRSCLTTILTLTYDIDLKSPASYGVDMIYSRAKVQGQRSVGSEDRVETNGQTDRSDLITSLADAIGENDGPSSKT